MHNIKYDNDNVQITSTTWNSSFINELYMNRYNVSYIWCIVLVP